ncbi:hypothetical protein SELR_10310 [Selenomonas ruminantium subsp. lactilytica TAM6421]|uniref:DUF445 domain-containing protein n=1 Tax=Selenomonas ruminantium subsp. lactilytica (strain NBRC 103574 / TAM6421) TaxID=927704 RepID=I0GPQ2_SELRL|nr:DUF445 domain-containing protein [Selenomonas ruminantium]BAL82739.1 hypothetical protein SELR_10310 [Selenomonas ruminantium subsp. lactilytica TAM6421]
MQKKNKANLALGISAAGFLGTLGLTGTFPAAMVHHGFLAATIGGLADWFAVTAIFHKPLGISYRTDILRRNRARIMDALVTFASEDLLSTDNIMNVLEKQNTGTLLAEYFIHRGGREKVHEVVNTVLLKAVNGLDSQRIARELAPAIKKGISSFPLEDILPEVLRLLAMNKHCDRLLSSMLLVGEQIIMSPALQDAILAHIRVLRENYEKDSAGRALIIASLGLSDEKILALLVDRMKAKIALWRSGEDHDMLKSGLMAMLISLSQDERLKDILLDRKEQLLEHIDLTDYLAGWIEANLKGDDPFWLEQVRAYTDARIDEYIKSAAWQAKFDQMVKDFLRAELVKHHGLIPGIIRERLYEFSDDELVEFVEDKVQDDLQMIRINGSIVGALAGMGLYILIALAERMWG